MKKNLYFCFVLIFLTGCANSITTPQTQATDEVYAFTKSPSTFVVTQTSPVPTLTLTPTKNTVTPTPSKTPGFTPTPGTGLPRTCLSIQPVPSGGLEYPGKLILGNPDSNLEIYDFRTGEVSELPVEREAGLFVSPDYKKFAHYNFSDKALEIFSSDGKLVKAFPFKIKQLRLTGWLDNDQLVFVVYDENNNDPPNVSIVNPFTGKTKGFPPAYPDLDTLSFHSNWFSGPTVYDPTLERVVYPALIGDPQAGYVLYSIPDEKKLAEIPYLDNTVSAKWSPDGSKFLIIKREEFLIVTRDGLVTNTPYQDLVDDLSFYGWSYTWAPDNRHVALWLGFGNPFDELLLTLAVLDTESGKINDICILAGSYSGLAYTHAEPIWAPDGKSLVVLANSASEQNGNVVLIDIERNAAFSLVPNQFPFGWLLEP